jgi:hypothetical protein
VDAVGVERAAVTSVRWGEMKIRGSKSPEVSIDGVAKGLSENWGVLFRGPGGLLFNRWTGVSMEGLQHVATREAILSLVVFPGSAAHCDPAVGDSFTRGRLQFFTPTSHGQHPDARR